MFNTISLSFVFSFLLQFTYETNTKSHEDPLISTADYDVIKIIKRPKTYYTQGLFFADNGNTLYESGGLYGQSVLVKMEYPSLKQLNKTNLPETYFAEGIARCGDNLYQLTWRENVIIKYSFPSMKYEDTLQLDKQVLEGWGLSQFNNPDELIATDGSSNIFVLDCHNDLKVKRKISVRDASGEFITSLNELKYAKDYIWANRYTRNTIYKIDPKEGAVVKVYDMTPLVEYEFRQSTLSQFANASGDVLNGIAYDEISDKFLVTGKRWGFYYEVIFK
jgi:glutamine cyclotransferase